MPRSFEILAESVASVEQLHAAFGCEEYWLACIAGGRDANNRVTLDSLTVDDDGTVSVRSTQHVGRQLLPKPVLKLLPGDLKIVNCETWRPVGDGQVHGQSSISAPVGSGKAEVWLSPTSNGSRLRYAVKVEVKIPLVGGQFEKAIGASLSKSIPAGVQFAEAWIAEHA